MRQKRDRTVWSWIGEAVLVLVAGTFCAFALWAFLVAVLVIGG
jgi:hypothetical protein